MAALFKERVSSFGSLISLIAVTAMLAVFSLSLPEFLASAAGRLFAAAWAILALVIFLAHARRLAAQPRRVRLPGLAAGRGPRPQKEKQPAVRLLRG
jgi:outer membrane biosynthesis protein TonB